ncbi:MAG: hypothetical protein ABL903_15105 [Methylococcales bacterium]
MKRLVFNKQRGAVLAFSLVMLLLLTLVSISMIRQNKAQINIASNAGQQVKAFATVETALLQTQAILEPMRYVGTAPYPAATRHCRANNPIDEGDTIAGLPTGVTAVVRGVYCISDYVDPDGAGPRRATGNEARCLYTEGARNLVVGSVVAANPSATPPVAAVPSIDNVNACSRLDHAGGWVAGPQPVPNPRCQIEVYTLNVTMVDAITNAERTVESKFEIDCSNDFNP